jgi:hypothetical protein
MLIFSILKFLFILIFTTFFFVLFACFCQAWKYRHFEGISLFRALIRSARARHDVIKLITEKDVKFIKWIFPLSPGIVATHPDSLKVIYFFEYVSISLI